MPNDSVERARQFLASQAKGGCFECMIGEDRTLVWALPSPMEIGSTLLVLEAAYSERRYDPLFWSMLKSVQSHTTPGGKIFFFAEHSRLPLDAETTAYGLGILKKHGAIGNRIVDNILEEIAGNVDTEGRVRVYFEPCPKENRTDIVSAVNILYLFYVMGQEKRVEKTEAWIRNTLRSRVWESRYYHSADAFPYFLSRLVAAFPDKFLGCRQQLLKAVHRRHSASMYPLDLAMRVAASKRLGVVPVGEEAHLAAQQQEDGGWPADAIYHWGRSRGYFGSRVISTALAIEAITI
jgi:hypothetical protein